MKRNAIITTTAFALCAAIWLALVSSDPSSAQMAAGTINAKQNGTWNVGLSTGSNTIGKVDQGANNATPWNQNVSQYGGTATSLGQKAMSASVPVVISSDQSSIAVTLGGQSTVVNGQQAVTATAAALPSNSTKQTCVKALAANTLTVYIGASGVTTANGMELGPGDAICLNTSNSNLIYVIASSTGSSVAYVGTN